LLFAIQTVINVGVNTGLLPTKGLTLPFVSFGGNSLIVSCVLLGMVARSMLEGGRSHG
jgi:cell division protein FtsW